MRRVLTSILVLSWAALVAGVAFGQGSSAKQVKRAEVKGEEYHHLLMLDLREAAEHAKALHHYAQLHAGSLEKQVVVKHVDELTKNLDGIQTELANVEQSVTEGERPGVEARLSLIRTQEGQARQDLDALEHAVSTNTLDRTVIAQKSLAIYQAMSKAREHHRMAMMKRGVHEPKEPMVKK